MNQPQDYLPHVYREPLLCYPALPACIGGQVILEVGPGRGDYLFHLARENPQSLVCGIELMPERFEKLMVRRDKQELDNVWLMQGDARVVLPKVFKASASVVHINFPDPWPKRKHIKNRLMQSPFIAACAECLLPGGVLYFTTDSDDYAEWTAKLMAQSLEFTSVYEPSIQTESDESYPSYFFKKWRDQGRTIKYQKYRRSSLSPQEPKHVS